jgi:hypothetical protein
LGKIGIRAFGAKSLMPSESRAEGFDVDGFNIRNEYDRVGNASINKVGLMGNSRQIEKLRRTMVAGTAHVERHQITLKNCSDETGSGLEAHAGRIFWQETSRKPCKTACSIATHLGLPAIAIVISHAEICGSGGRFHSKQTISANSSVAIAKTSDSCAIKRETSRAVIKDDEVVSRAVHFGESNIHEKVRIRGWELAVQSSSKKEPRPEDRGSKR